MSIPSPSSSVYRSCAVQCPPQAPQRLAEAGGHEVLEHLVQVAQEPVQADLAGLVLDEPVGQHDLSQPQGVVVPGVWAAREPHSLASTWQQVPDIGQRSSQCPQPGDDRRGEPGKCRQPDGGRRDDLVLGDVGQEVVVADQQRHSQPVAPAQLVPGAQAPAQDRLAALDLAIALEHARLQRPFRMRAERLGQGRDQVVCFRHADRAGRVEHRPPGPAQQPQEPSDSDLLLHPDGQLADPGDADLAPSPQLPPTATDRRGRRHARGHQSLHHRGIQGVHHRIPAFAKVQVGHGPSATAQVVSSSTTLCSAALAGGVGTCQLTASQLPAGSYPVLAAYAGDGARAASHSQPQTLAVAPSPSTLASSGQQGYVLAAAGGTVYAYGTACDGGANTVPGGPSSPIVGVALDPTTGGTGRPPPTDRCTPSARRLKVGAGRPAGSGIAPSGTDPAAITARSGGVGSAGTGAAPLKRGAGLSPGASARRPSERLGPGHLGGRAGVRAAWTTARRGAAGARAAPGWPPPPWPRPRAG